MAGPKALAGFIQVPDTPPLVEHTDFRHSYQLPIICANRRIICPLMLHHCRNTQDTHVWCWLDVIFSTCSHFSFADSQFLSIYVVFLFFTHPAKILRMTVQPTMKGTIGFLVLPLIAPSSTTKVTRQVMATSPNRALSIALSDCSTANAAPWALAYFSPEVIACWHQTSFSPYMENRV